MPYSYPPFCLKGGSRESVYNIFIWIMVACLYYILLLCFGIGPDYCFTLKNHLMIQADTGSRSLLPRWSVFVYPWLILIRNRAGFKKDLMICPVFPSLHKLFRFVDQMVHHLFLYYLLS